MKRTATLPTVLALAALFAACADETVSPEPRLGPPSADLSMAPEGISVGGNHIVVFARGVPSDFEEAVASVGGTLEYAFDEVGAAVVSGLDESAARRLGRVKGVQYVEAEPMFELVEPVHQLDPTSVDLPASPTDPTTAWGYPYQWHMRAVGADVAWAAGRLGSSSVTAAILDTGLDYRHQDLWGRVDLSRSASFVAFDDYYVNAWYPWAHPIADLHGHGTHVGSTVSSNGYATAGITSQVTLIGVKVCSFYIGCPGSSIFAGLVHAVQNGADVINMSLGGGFYKKSYPGYVSVINRVFNWARTSGVTIVVAAGNAAHDIDHNGNIFITYCDTPGVVCISATGPTASGGWLGPFTNVDAPASYTNFGRSAINVAAPGGTGAGYVWASCSYFSYWWPVCGTGGTWILGITGTSMASPHVAGTAALLVEDYGRRPGRITSALQQSADDLGQRGTDPFYGKGRLNVARAVGAM